MEQSEITKDLKQHFDNAAYINMTQAGAYLGWGATKTRGFLQGVDHIKCGKEKRFHVKDIARHLVGFRNAS